MPRLDPLMQRPAAGLVAAVAALWLLAAPHAASAQWWNDEGLYDDDVYYGSEEYYDRMEEYTDRMDDTAMVSEATEDYYNVLENRADTGAYRYGYGYQDYSPYYAERFEDDDWSDWW